jgi:hypothetical protein
MKFSLACLCLLLLSTLAGADEDRIGFYADVAGSETEVVIPPGVLVEIYLMAHLPSFPDGIRVAEFAVDNWPGSPGESYGISSVNWTTPLVIGGLDEDYVALGFPDEGAVPDAEGRYLLAVIEIFAISAEWLRCDLRIEVVASRCEICEYEAPVVVVDEGLAMHYVAGDVFFINPSEESATPVEDSAISRVKALYR